jgi:hypothetical protein
MDPKHNNDPLVRIGQGDYARDYYPHDFDDPPNPNEGGSVALIVLIVVFLLGVLIGGVLW